MCGIVGYIGPEKASSILLEGLQRLEYRGYDSAGVAVIAPDGQLNLRREVGKLRNLAASLQEAPLLGSVGIGHTRWATHGRPTTYNAHPHTDTSGRFLVVHNGIIENFLSLRRDLIAQGVEFKSDTDSETLAHLIATHYQGDLLTAVRLAIQHVEGTYAIAVMFQGDPDRLVAARHGSPLILGCGEGENFIASDIPAILNYTRRMIYLEDGDLAEVRADRIAICDLAGSSVARPSTVIDWNLVAAEKGGFDHFMLKEIYEQPTAIGQTVGGRIDDIAGRIILDELNLAPQEIKKIERICFVACGTSYHAALVGETYLETLARIPCEVEYASEFRYRNPIVDEKTLVIGISQSGETADTLAALREAKRLGAATLGILNVKGSAISRETTGTIYIHAGPEIGVASTKAYTSTLAALYLLALHIGQVRDRVTTDQIKEAAVQLRRLPQLIETMLAEAHQIDALVSHFMTLPHAIFLGRGVHVATALEGALKLKELSYLHAQGFPAGEMKHGPLALIEPLTPVVSLATASSTYEKVVSNIKEAKARDAFTLTVATQGDEMIRDVSDRIIYAPAVDELLSPIVNIIPLQLLAYYVSTRKGCDVDQPRNLAKSVTVE